MQIKLYTTNSPDNLVGKLLNDETELEVNFKAPENKLTPNIKLNIRPETFTYNYVYIEDLGRYYFIRDAEIINTNLVELQLEVDVLETYKDDILNSKATVTKHNGARPYYDGGSYLNEVEKEHKLYYSNIKPEYEETVLMTKLGGV